MADAGIGFFHFPPLITKEREIQKQNMISNNLITGLVISTFAMTATAREAFTINDGWRFTFAGDTAATQVHLPHSWNGDAYSTRNYRRGAATYEKDLRIPARLAGERIYLKLDGAASKSDVAIDGKTVGRHVGAYSAHTLDITPYVTPGSTHKLTVTVDNSDKSIPPYSADFTFMGGLYRDAWLIGKNSVHLDILSGPKEGVKVTPALLADGSGEVGVAGEVLNRSERKQRVTVSVKLFDPSGREVAAKSSKLDIASDGGKEFRLMLDKLKNPELWSPESPALYKLVTEISDNGKLLDRSETATAFRTFGFDNEGRFLLNGKPYKLRGMCRHQDQKPMGIALTDEQHRRDMELMKDLGTNFIRISHYPQDDAILEMCDRLGLIAWEEVPVIDYVPDDPDFADNSETMVRDMIRRHYNHPSVAMWGYMNEILLRTPKNEQEATRERTGVLARRLENVVREEDPTRLTTMAFHGSDVYHEAGLGEITDVKGWNLYQGWYGGRFPDFEAYLSRQHREHPDHKLIVSEYGAGSDLRIHSLTPEAFDFSMEYQQDYLEHYLPVIEDSAFVAGASHWNFIDFSSANRAESMPHINNKGLVTNDRRKKDVYYYYQAMWQPLERDTVAHIASRDWAIRTDISDNDYVIRPIKVYTNLPSVALSVNGHMMPAVKVSNNTALFDVPLHDGKNTLELFSGEIRQSQPLDAMTVDMKIIPVSDGKLMLGTDELAVNVGSDCYFRSDETGLTWLPDREYAPGSLYGHVGGKRNVSQDEIALTDDMPIFQRNLTGLEEYRIEVPDGRYEVELGFADLSSPSALSAYMLGHNAGSRTPPTDMDVAINGIAVEEGFSPGKESGVKHMSRRRYLTEATEGNGITIRFTPRGGTTSLSTLKLRRL